MKRDTIYIIVIILLATACVIFYNRGRELFRSNQRKDSIISEQNDTIRYQKNEMGRMIAEKSAATATPKEIDKAYPELKEQLLRELDVKLRDLKAYMQNEIRATGQGRSTVTNNYYLDSAGNKVEYRDVDYDDGYLKFTSTVFEDLDFGDAFYTYSDTITTAIHSKKNWIFGRERLLASTSLRNPNARSIKTTNILVDNYRDKRFVIYGGVGYDPFNNRPVLNVGIGYAIFKF